MADTAYDADHFRQAIADKGALAVIPNNPSRSRKHPLDEHLYAQRHLVECCFSKLKQFRRVATRYEKTAPNYLAVITIAAIAESSLRYVDLAAMRHLTTPESGKIRLITDDEMAPLFSYLERADMEGLEPIDTTGEG